MPSKRLSAQESSKRQKDRLPAADPTREVPIQVMVPESIRRQVAMMGVNRGENIRTVVLRGLQAIGIDVPESELTDRRGRRRKHEGSGNDAK